jgi:hypothetical protein
MIVAAVIVVTVVDSAVAMPATLKSVAKAEVASAMTLEVSVQSALIAPSVQHVARSQCVTSVARHLPSQSLRIVQQPRSVSFVKSAQ